MSGSEPEETAPFTHRPYGDDQSGENPFISPSGPAGQPSGPSYVTPLPPPPPMASPPYGPPMSQQPMGPGWGQGYVPVYGAPLPGSQDHKGATTALVLGIISVVSLVLTPFCCVTIVGLFCAPFAWVVGARARKEIDASPGTYGNASAAMTGMVMGIVCTALGVLLIVGMVALFAWIGGGYTVM